MRRCPQCGSSYEDRIAFCPADGAKTEPYAPDSDRDPLIGKVIDGRYRVEQRIGKGGMGIVYRASHVVLNKPFALKVIRGEQAADPNLVERFVREARAASAIGHPNIVDINDFGTTDDGAAYLAMEYLDGLTLAEAMQAGPIAYERALSIFVQIAGALEAAHAQGIVHRDLKPENIFLTRSDESEHGEFVKVLDFGIAKVKNAAAKLTRTGLVFGTPNYMSPEQAAGQPVDHRTDIYSLGVIMYQVLAGQLPFTAESLMALITKHMFESPPSLRATGCAVPSALDAIVTRCLQKKPELRHPSMRALEADLRRVQVSQASEPRPSAPHARMSMAVSLASAAPPASFTVASETLDAALLAHSADLAGDDPVRVPKRRPLWLWLVAASVLVLLIVLSLGSPDSSPPSATPAVPGTSAAAPVAAPGSVDSGGSLTTDNGTDALPSGLSAPMPASSAPEPSTPKLDSAPEHAPPRAAAKPSPARAASARSSAPPKAQAKPAAKPAAQHGESLLDPWR